MNNTKKSTRVFFALLFIAYAAIYVGRKNAVYAAGAHDWKRGSRWLPGEGGL